jgi:hypothetical protein
MFFFRPVSNFCMVLLVMHWSCKKRFTSAAPSLSNYKTFSTLSDFWVLLWYEADKVLSDPLRI